MAAVDAQAAVCKNSTPQYSDVVNDNMYVKSKCKTLVAQVDRNRLSSVAKGLHQALLTATSDYATLKIGSGKIEDMYDTIRGNRTVFDIAKKAVMVMACLHVLHSMSGHSQLAEAETLKDKIDGAPLPLRDAIGVLAAKNKKPAETAAKRRRIGKGTGDDDK